MSDERGRPRSRRWVARVRYAFWFAVCGCLAAAAVATRLGTRWPSIYYMTGPSMEPTIGAGEYFIAWSSPRPQLAAGQLVVFRFEDEDGVFHVLRRLVALPGDTVLMRDGVVFLNGRRQPWPYRILQPAVRVSPLARTHNLFTWGPRVVPPESVFVLADLRDVMGWPDSRFIGFVARDDVLARATRTLTARKLR